jgi:hypothetical protein
MIRRFIYTILLSLLLVGGAPAQVRSMDGPGKTVVFWQAGFPTISSEAIDQATLTAALGDAAFAGVDGLNEAATLAGANLLVLPYGSAVPTGAWKSISQFVNRGGSLLILGGQPLEVPVTERNGLFVAQRAQDSYANTMGLRHTYEVPVLESARFVWKPGYEAGRAPAVRAKHFYAEEGRLDGLGYMADAEGELVAAPVIYGSRWGGGRLVALDFDPEPEYWKGADGMALIRRAADFARQPVATFSVEALFSTLRPGEVPILSVHLKLSHSDVAPRGEVKAELQRDGRTLETLTIPLNGASGESLALAFHQALPAGFYEVAASWSDQGHVREFYRNGFWVSPPEALKGGPKLAANEDTLTLDGKPFLPVGTNYFGTEENGWDFSGPRNAANWERDFAEMQAHGVSFVRTGVWMPNARFIDGDLGGANERFLRNLEAYLLCAQKHHIAVNFTFFAFTPRSGNQRPDEGGTPPANPYLDGGALHAEEAYVSSVVSRFKDVPFLSWDLINEPSFSNPRNVFKGNYPNNDPSEVKAWQKWLRERYEDLAPLADAWSVTPEELGSFDAIPLPAIGDLNYARNGSTRQVRAVDYNLFAQEMFRGWVTTMVKTIRDAGGKQIVNVGQDEGGVSDRVLNQFYADAGVAFTTNHTYWQDDALLWDSLAAKVVGVPNITGETGYQPSWAPDGAWRFDELSALGLTERKWALGFAAGSTGAMQWDWAREVDFGMLRSDGSSKVWENMMRDLGAFAQAAAPHAVGLKLPEIALVLPQSLQMSVLKGYAQEAQQSAVRALYQVAHGAAYAVGEYQIERLGTPKLILLPSPLGMTDAAWAGIEARVREGATLLVTGPFDEDEHLHATDRAKKLGLDYATVPLDLRDDRITWPGGSDSFSFAWLKTTVLMEAALPDGGGWREMALGKGRILFTTLPLELSGNLDAVGRVYGYAMKLAGVVPLAIAGKNDPGILVCPTEYKDATLYVLTSETQAATVRFTDRRSGKEFSARLDAGRAALMMVGVDGKVIGSYRWKP